MRQVFLSCKGKRFVVECNQKENNGMRETLQKFQRRMQISPACLPRVLWEYLKMMKRHET